MVGGIYSPARGSAFFCLILENQLCPSLPRKLGIARVSPFHSVNFKIFMFKLMCKCRDTSWLGSSDNAVYISLFFNLTKLHFTENFLQVNKISFVFLSATLYPVSSQIMFYSLQHTEMSLQDQKLFCEFQLIIVNFLQLCRKFSITNITENLAKVHIKENFLQAYQILFLISSRKFSYTPYCRKFSARLQNFLGVSVKGCKFSANNLLPCKQSFFNFQKKIQHLVVQYSRKFSVML